MSASVSGMKPGLVYPVNYKGHKYGIIFYDDRIGVSKNVYGKIKYMPVMFDYNVGSSFPKLFKTRLKFGSTAGDLLHLLVTYNKLGKFIPKCITVCEHILKYGHGIRR